MTIHRVVAHITYTFDDEGDDDCWTHEPLDDLTMALVDYYGGEGSPGEALLTIDDDNTYLIHTTVPEGDTETGEQT